MYIQRRKSVKAGTEVAPEASELLFEATDVAELVAEITGEDVEVTTDEMGDVVTFDVGEDSFTVESEGGEEILESRRLPAGKKPVSASTRRNPAARHAGRTVKKIAGSRR